MKKDIVNACIFLLIIVLVASLCSCPRIEGLTTSSGLDRDYTGINKITNVPAGTLTTTSNMLFSTGDPTPNAAPKESDPNSNFCAYIDGTSLKIAKRTIVSTAAVVAAPAVAPMPADPLTGTPEIFASPEVFGSPATKSTWTVIWNSTLAGYSGNELKMVGTVLQLGETQLGAGTGGEYAKLTIEGDLVICNAANVTVWSLVANQLDLITQLTNEYLNMSSRTDRSVYETPLNQSYTNFNNYVNSLNLTNDALSDTYEKLKRIRHKMDFQIQELNGVANSKINTSNETLQSTMYLNLGIAVLVASVFILISTR
jgi:hypothetical protein